MTACGTDNIDDTVWYSFLIDPIPIEYVLYIEAGPTLLIFSFFVYLSLRMRKKAWNTASKRFTRSFETSYLFLSLIALISHILIVKDANFNTYFFVSFIFPIIFISCTTFYSSVTAAALLFHTVFPLLPEEQIRSLESRKAKGIGILLEVIVPISAILYVILNIVTAFRFTTEEEDADDDIPFKIYAIILGSTSVMLFISFVLNISSIVCLIVFICILARSNVNNNILLKFIPFFGLILASTLVSFALIVILIACSAQLEGPVVIVNALLSCILVIAINTLTFSRDVIWCCCKCCWRRRMQANPNGDRAPLLVNSMEGLQTNPISVWDHRNDPSGTTATVYHPEMTDCRSDCEQ